MLRLRDMRAFLSALQAQFPLMSPLMQVAEIRLLVVPLKGVQEPVSISFKCFQRSGGAEVSFNPGAALWNQPSPVATA